MKQGLADLNLQGALVREAISWYPLSPAAPRRLHWASRYRNSIIYRAFRHRPANRKVIRKRRMPTGKEDLSRQEGRRCRLDAECIKHNSTAFPFLSSRCRQARGPRRDSIRETSLCQFRPVFSRVLSNFELLHAFNLTVDVIFMKSDRDIPGAERFTRFSSLRCFTSSEFIFVGSLEQGLEEDRVEKAAPIYILAVCAPTCT